MSENKWMTDAESRAYEKERFKKWHPRTHAVAEIKYSKALDLIERARNLLSLAAGELSPLCWAGDEYSNVSKSYDQIHQLWRDVAYSVARQKCYIDDYGLEAAKKQYPGEIE